MGFLNMWPTFRDAHHSILEYYIMVDPTSITNDIKVENTREKDRKYKKISPKVQCRWKRS
jgi:hypothetical protein